MYKLFLKLAILSLMFGNISSVFADTIIHAGKYFDSVKASVVYQASIVVKQGKIVSVEQGYKQPDANQTVVDLRSMFVLPGLIDMHVHLTDEYDHKSYERRVRFNAPDYAIQAVVNAEKTLMAGFTAVRNPGDGNNETISLRNAINRGIIPGPRVFSAGKSLATTGGHADPTNGLSRKLYDPPNYVRGVVNGPTEIYKGVRQRYKDGADFIKITATGGVLSVAKSGQNPQFTEEELLAVVAAAKDYGFKVAVHAHGLEGIKRAITAGVDSIEHGTYMDEVAMRLMKRYGTYYVPTILAGEWVAQKAEEEGFFPDLVRPKAMAIGPQIQDTFSKAVAAGVKIAFGTDSGVSAHGDNAQEFALMVEAGMKAADALQSATLNAADLLGQPETLGQIAPGFHADIIAVEGDPTVDISVMEDVKFVMKSGEIYKQ